jgi:maltose/maltodextrin transport system substrate-binding protein/arabinogalactan oligomer/maltooligosaccharide transport system substrate-binding protein
MVVSLAGVAAFAQAGITIFADDTRTPVLTQLGAAYEAETGVKVTVVEYAWNDLKDNYITKTQAGEGPDILIGGHDWVGELVANGLVAPIDLGSKAADFSGASLQAFTVGDSLYGLPYAQENIALIYDKDVVPVPPRTWDELLAICRSVYDPDIPYYGLIFQNTASNFYQFYPFISAAGGYIFGYNDDGTYNPCDVGIANEGAIFGANLYKSMTDEGILPTGVDWDTLNALVAGKHAAMIITGPWMVNAISEAGYNYGITTIPAVKGPTGAYSVPNVFMGLQGFFLSSFSENKTIATDFLVNYIATEDAMKELVAQGNRNPTYLPVVKYASADTQAFGQQAAFGLAMPSIPAMNSVWAEGGNAIDLINSGTPAALALTQARLLILEAVGCNE